MRTIVAKQKKRKSQSKDECKNGKPIQLESVLESLRALWEATDETEPDVRGDLQKRIVESVSRLDKTVRTKINITQLVQSRNQAESAQVKLFSDEETASPPPSRFESAEIRVFVTDLGEQALKFVPEASKYKSIEAYRKFLVEKLSYNSVSTRKRNAGYLINRFFPGHYLHPDLTAFASAARQDRLGDVLFYLTARAEAILQEAAEKVVWPALPVGTVTRAKIRDLVRGHLKTDSPTKRTTIAIAQCYSRFGIADVTKTKLRVAIRTGDLASFAYILHLEFPEPGMQLFEKVLDGPMHKWLLWDRQWMIQQLYRLREEGLISKVSEIDSMRQFTTKYSLAEATPHIVNLIGKEDV